MKKKVKKVNKRWRRWRGSAHGWAPVPGQPHMARNVLIVIGLIVLGVLVFCLCCYKVNQAFHLLNWLTWYPPVFWWLIRDICTKIRSHYIFKHIDTMIGSRGRGPGPPGDCIPLLASYLLFSTLAHIATTDFPGDPSVFSNHHAGTSTRKPSTSAGSGFVWSGQHSNYVN